MAKFCKYCGKELVDGKCDCAEFLASQAPEAASAAAGAAVTATENAAAVLTGESGTALENAAAEATQKTTTALENAAAEATEQTTTAVNNAVASEIVSAEGAAKAAQNAAGAGQAAASTAGNTVRNAAQAAGETVKNAAGAVASGATAAAGAVAAAAKNADYAGIFEVTLDLLKNGFAKPVSCIRNVTKRNQGSALIFLAIYALVVFLTMWIHLPIGDASKYVGGGYRALIALCVVVLIAAAIGLKALLGWKLAKKADPELGYVEAVAKLSAANLWSCCAVLLAFLLGIFWPLGAFTVLTAGLIAWIIFSELTLSEWIGGDADGKALRLFVSEFAVVIVVAILSYLFFKGMYEGLGETFAVNYAEAYVERLFR